MVSPPASAIAIAMWASEHCADKRVGAVCLHMPMSGFLIAAGPAGKS